MSSIAVNSRPLCCPLRVLGLRLPPRFKLGAIVEDEIRGSVRVIGQSGARIPWPLAFYGRQRALIVCGELIRAVTSESVEVVAHWWGVSVERVRLMRRALGASAMNEGSIRLWTLCAQTPAFRRMARKARANAATPERRAKVAAANLCKKRPASVGRKIAAASAFVGSALLHFGSPAVSWRSLGESDRVLG
jgi:hypothetical protein